MAGDAVRARGSFSVYQDGVKVAGGSGPWEAMKREAMHYAAVYAQDGPVRCTLRRLKPRAAVERAGGDGDG